MIRITRDLTPEIFSNFMSEIGEDFCDDYGCEHIDFKMFGGYLIAKEPTLQKELIEIVYEREGYGFISINELFEEKYGGWDKALPILYGHISDFVNMDLRTKIKINTYMSEMLKEELNEN